MSLYNFLKKLVVREERVEAVSKIIDMNGTEGEALQKISQIWEKKKAHDPEVESIHLGAASAITTKAENEIRRRKNAKDAKARQDEREQQRKKFRSGRGQH